MAIWKLAHTAFNPYKTGQNMDVRAKVVWEAAQASCCEATPQQEKQHVETVTRNNERVELKDVVVDYSTKGKLVLISEDLHHDFKDQADKIDGHSIIVLFGSHRGGHKG